ncbi:MAG: hypothetical protein WBG92_19405, partial [Thiohalocapsa sp.]
MIQFSLDTLRRGGIRQHHNRERYPDGSTIHTFVMDQGLGAPLIRAWIERPVGEEPVEEEIKLSGIEHGFLGIGNYRVRLGGDLLAWYASDGDRQCDGTFDHYYGNPTVYTNPQQWCAVGPTLQWPDPLPEQDTLSLGTIKDGERLAPSNYPTSLKAFARLPETTPAAYSGLMRALVQAKGGTHLLFGDIGAASHKATGMLRDLTEERLAYWRVDIASSGVVARKMKLPEGMDGFIHGVHTGYHGGHSIPTAERHRAESVILNYLVVDNEEPEQFTLISAGVINAETGGGLAYLDGWPFYSMPTFGAGFSQSAQKAVLTDIRAEFGQPYVNTTLEFAFGFDEETGVPNCSVSKLNQGVWLPDGDHAYFYRQSGGVFCQVFPRANPDGLSAEAVIIAAWYDESGSLQKIQQSPSTSEYNPGYEEGDPSNGVVGTLPVSYYSIGPHTAYSASWVVGNTAYSFSSHSATSVYEGHAFQVITGELGTLAYPDDPNGWPIKYARSLDHPYGIGSLANHLDVHPQSGGQDQIGDWWDGLVVGANEGKVASAMTLIGATIDFSDRFIRQEAIFYSSRVYRPGPSLDAAVVLTRRAYSHLGRNDQTYNDARLHLGGGSYEACIYNTETKDFRIEVSPTVLAAEKAYSGTTPLGWFGVCSGVATDAYGACDGESITTQYGLPSRPTGQ